MNPWTIATIMLCGALVAAGCIERIADRSRYSLLYALILTALSASMALAIRSMWR